MGKVKMHRYYCVQIIKSVLTVVGCMYLVQFDDTRVLATVIGYISSVMLVSWISDYVEICILTKKQ